MTGKRRVGVSLFKGKQMVNIREYYEKDGETLPGKKVGSVFLRCLFAIWVLVLCFCLNTWNSLNDHGRFW